nr:hypothetical protein [uncultured Desulfuromonas sp.]
MTVIFCGKRDKAQQYVQGTDFDKAREIWNRHFSPRAMIVALNDIEKQLGLDADLRDYLHVHRQQIYQMHTQSAHNTYSVLGILSFDSDLANEGEVSQLYPALHGRVGAAAKSTLKDTIDVLGYAVLMLFLLFRDKHKYQSREQDSFWSRSQSLAIGSLDLWFGARGFQPTGKLWDENKD